VLWSLTATIGRPDPGAFHRALAGAGSAAALDEVVGRAVGESGLMELARFDAGEVLRKDMGRDAPGLLRLRVGNPLIMKEMDRTVPDAASYAPVTILVSERPGGVHLSYDLVATLLAPYGSDAALAIARELDAKVQALLAAPPGDPRAPRSRGR
jgi:hypothetical protein